MSLLHHFGKQDFSNNLCLCAARLDNQPVCYIRVTVDSCNINKNYWCSVFLVVLRPKPRVFHSKANALPSRYIPSPDKHYCLKFQTRRTACLCRSTMPMGLWQCIYFAGFSMCFLHLLASLEMSMCFGHSVTMHHVHCPAGDNVSRPLLCRWSVK